jgi:hypothetical protein
VIVQQGRNQIVRSRYGVEVAGEMKVDIFHRDNLRVSAAGCSAFYAEARSERGFANGGDGILSDFVQSHGQTDIDRGFSFPCGRGIDRCNQNEFAVFFVFLAGQNIQRYFYFVLTVLFEIFLFQTQFFSDF